MLLAFSFMLATATVGPPSGAPPCAACLHWLTSPEGALRLLQSGDPLDGIELVMSAEPPPEVALALVARGAAVGLMVTSTNLRVPPASLGRFVIVEVEEDEARAKELTFRVKRFATAVRAQRADARVGLMASVRTLQWLRREGIGAYCDFIVATDGRGPEEAWGRLGASAATTLEAVLAASSAAGGRPLLVDLPAGGETVAVAAGRLREWLPEALTELPSVRVTCGDGVACAASVYIHPRTLEAVALVRARDPVRELKVTPAAAEVELRPLASTGPGGMRPVVDGPDGSRVDAGNTRGSFALRIVGWAGEGARFSKGVEVEAERPLAVEEVVARHQAAAARKRQRVKTLISTGSTVVTFQLPGLSAPMTVAAETVLYDSADRREIEYRSLRLNGMELAGAGTPRLPIVEPERWAAPPLAISLDEAYRYRLEGRERVAGRDCYVVRFDPLVRGRALASGRAWVERVGFALARMETVQTRLRGPIVSSRERDDFVPIVVGGATEWVLSRSEVHQLYEGAGHRTPVHRLVTLETHEPNPPEFAARVADAEASPSVMLEQTASGVRYLQRARGGAEGRRVAAGTGSRVAALALGVLVDPNITRRLPFAGASFSDLDFLGTGAQVNVFVAGAFARAAWSAPAFGAWKVEGSAFASLVTYNDRSFRGGLEKYDENLRQRPARMSLETARPLGDRWRLRAAYELSHTRLSRSADTGADFIAPVSPTVHGLRLELETHRGPWTVAGWWSPAWRQRWTEWGPRMGADFDRGTRSYERWGLSAARTFVPGPRGVARVEAAWLGGRRLDRFSRYGFDGFESRLRGYPGASIRFDHGAVVRGSATRELARGWRAEAFLDTALVRDPGAGPRLRGYTGVGAGVQAALPLRALLSLEWGYGFQGRGPGGRRGTQALRLTVLKPL